MSEYETQKLLEDWFITTLLSSAFKAVIDECETKTMKYLQDKLYTQVYIYNYGYYCPYVVLNIYRNQGLFQEHPYIKETSKEISVKYLNKKDNPELFDLLVNTQKEISFIIQTIKRIAATYNFNYTNQWIKDYIPAILIDKHFVELKKYPSKDFNFTNEDKLTLTKFKQILQINTVKSLLLN